MPRLAPLAKLTVLAALPLAAAVVGVLYGMTHKDVHAGGPPAQLAPFALDPKPAPVRIAAFGDAAGKRHSLREFRGHYVLLNLWAIWCAPCVKELPALAKLKEDVPGLRVVVVDWGPDPAAATAFLKDHKVASLGDYIDKDGALASAFHAYGLPITVLVDPQGNEIGRAEGGVTWDTPEATAYFKDLTAPPGS